MRGKLGSRVVYPLRYIHRDTPLLTGEFVENIKMVVDAIGVNHVGIGTDTDLLSPRPGNGTNQAWPGMTGGFFPVVVEECLRQGFTAEDIGLIGGGNFGRVFGAVIGA